MDRYNLRMPNRIRELRLARGLTQAELAVLVGTRQNQLSRWEAGQEPRAGAAVSLATALGVRIEDLGLAQGRPAMAS